MKHTSLHSLLLTLFTFAFMDPTRLWAQVGIGTTSGSVNPSAALEIKPGPYPAGSAYRGLLVPTVNSTQRAQIQNPATGLLIYNLTTNQIEVNTGSPTAPVWTPGGSMGSSGSAGWSLTGNAGTTSNNFLGTTDNVPFQIRVNNQNSGRIDPTLFNLGLGYLTINPATTGQSNTALGTYTLYKLTTGSYNTATGFQALLSNTTGVANTAMGAAALIANTIGTGNSAFGNIAMQNNTTGSTNTALGLNALRYNTTGDFNTAAGGGALQSNTTAVSNSAFGHNALAANTTGFFNVGVGEDALVNNIDGRDNVAVGTSSMSSNTSGGFNTALGNVALAGNTTGQANTAAGRLALQYNTTGSYNTALGYNAGPMSANSGLTNAAAIGANAMVSQSNSMVLGNGVNVGIGNTAPQNRLEITRGVANQSGLRLTNLTSNSPAIVSSQTKFLTVDGNGDVILGTLSNSGRLGITTDETTTALAKMEARIARQQTEIEELKRMIQKLQVKK